jgi:hypothetical protein
MARTTQDRKGKRVVVANSRKTRAVKAPRKLLGGKGKAIAQLKKENRERSGSKLISRKIIIFADWIYSQEPCSHSCKAGQ